jgi:glycosyltransferase involved in cell wall biosynthesis
MKILNIYNAVSNTTIPYELELHMARTFKQDFFTHLCIKKGSDFLKEFFKVYKVIKNNDIIHSHHTLSSIVISFYSVLFIGRGKLFFFTIHRDYESLSLFKSLVYCLLIFPFRDKIICNSYSTQLSLPRYIRQLFSNRIAVIYNGVDLSSINYSVNFPSDKINIINIGRLIPDKDQITLIKMCSILSEYKVNYHLTICGSGPLQDMLSKEIEKRGLTSRVSLLGNVERSIVYKKLSNSCVYISTSLTEGFGNSNVEAMASGSPVIVTDIPINAEITNCKKLTFPVGDYKELSSIVIKLCHDERYFKMIALSGLEKSKKFSLESAANSYHFIYTDNKL